MTDNNRDVINEEPRVKTYDDMKKYILFGRKPHKYQKTYSPLIRKGVIGETIQTIINGLFEYERVITEPCAVVKGVLDEEYIISLNELQKKYENKELTDEFTVFQSVSHINALEFRGPDTYFETKFGYKMLLQDGDMINTDFQNIYRIKRQVFILSYKIIEE